MAYRLCRLSDQNGVRSINLRTDQEHTYCFDCVELQAWMSV